MSQNTKKIPVWLGGESGQRKRYLRSLEKELAAELGPDWRDKIADSPKVAARKAAELHDKVTKLEESNQALLQLTRAS